MGRQTGLGSGDPDSFSPGSRTIRNSLGDSEAAGGDGLQGWAVGEGFVLGGAVALSSGWRLTLQCVPSAVLVVLNHYLAFQYFAEEYYLFSEVRGRGGAAGGGREQRSWGLWGPCSVPEGTRKATAALPDPSGTALGLS